MVFGLYNATFRSCVAKFEPGIPQPKSRNSQPVPFFAQCLYLPAYRFIYPFPSFCIIIQLENMNTCSYKSSVELRR